MFSAAAASNQKCLPAETQDEFHYEVITGNKMCLFVRDFMFLINQKMHLQKKIAAGVRLQLLSKITNSLTLINGIRFLLALCLNRKHCQIGAFAL